MDPSHERILVVDDEAQLRGLFERILHNEGYEVRCASSGDEALKLLETQWFDLVVTDLKMPGMDGMELLAKGKLVSPTLPFIVLTAFGKGRSAVAAVKEGAYDYLVKPFDIEELKLVIKKALELHRLTREVERLRSQLELSADHRSEQSDAGDFPCGPHGGKEQRHDSDSRGVRHGQGAHSQGAAPSQPTEKSSLCRRQLRLPAGDPA